MIPLQFFTQYMKHPRSVGAILPSSRQLAEQMVASIRFESTDCIVEYGPGTGVFTEQLIQKKRNSTKLLLFENNRGFYELLQQKYGDMDNVHIIFDSAERVAHYLNKYGVEQVDYIVSGLPFASLPKEVSERILRETKKVLGQDGVFITFQYTRFKQKYLHSFFTSIQVDKVLRNAPPAFVFKCIQ
ncbi:class I SAM-dependent methyltransferase [Planococcus salinus]|uniref:Methyltransferase domain-containing protein n=1 Tax=Planococcus salinus TaxID=1848460 RepID=A0A3M8PB29_9BACL|nr:rRNA adenine N-6-methyltransferase family protein [Planococcus salinus]RNF40907.1 methyltransferase domain-containing protein [Planococcus salinus]